MGWAGGLVWFPSKHRWTQEKTKIGALQNAPSLFPGPKPNHLISLCLIEWLVWKYVLLVHVQLSPGNPAIFFPKNTLFTKLHGWPEKHPYKMPPFVTKKAPGMEHGSSHFIVEIYRKYTQGCFCEMSMCISTAQARTKRWPRDSCPAFSL